MYDDPTAAADRAVGLGADLGPDGRVAEPSVRVLRILVRAGEVGEKTSCVSSLTAWLILVDVAKVDTAVNRFGVGEGVLRRERSSGLTICAGEGRDLA